ncbi:MAG: hypothetical protein HOO96_04585 [Polyangiaceae bacterium]|nr:hypothetical protein [Polyangiaceae bacterium]
MTGKGGAAWPCSWRRPSRARRSLPVRSDVLELEALACAVAWVDLHTIVVLDAGGQVSFWSLRSGAGTIA